MMRRDSSSGWKAWSVAAVLAWWAASAMAGPSEPQIIGGTPAPSSKYPFVVALLWASGDPSDPLGSQRCGGTYVGNDWFMTAAHCVSLRPSDMGAGQAFPPVGCVPVPGHVRCDYSPVDFVALVGNTDLVAGAGPRIGIVAIETHPHFGRVDDPEHDIALLKLAASPPARVTPVKIGDEADETPWAKALTHPCRARHPQDALTDIVCKEMAEPIVIGWGVTEFDQPSPRLLETTVVAKDLQRCAFYNELYATWTDGAATPLTDKMLCAGWDTPPAVGGPVPDSCWGDSGGFLGSRTTTGTLVQNGIVSFGWSCGKRFLYNVYTRVSAYRDWIASTTAR